MKITFIGMGEAGSAIIQGWGENQPGPISAFDIKTDAPETAASMIERYRQLDVTGCESPAEAVSRADFIFCTVTADQAVTAAATAAPHLKPNAFWCDLNSCAPSSKRKAAAIIDGHGGRYVDVAVMSPVHPKLNLVPLLISGPHAEAVLHILQSLPMAPRLIAGDVGKASSIKMIRSVMVKGMEALTAECVLAAVAAGVEEEVLGSLARSHPGIDWQEQAAYNFERSMAHGARRAAEMEEVARALTDLGLPDDMTRSTVKWQRRIAETGIRAPEGAGARDLVCLLLPAIRE